MNNTVVAAGGSVYSYVIPPAIVAVLLVVSWGLARLPCCRRCRPVLEKAEAQLEHVLEHSLEDALGQPADDDDEPNSSLFDNDL